MKHRVNEILLQLGRPTIDFAKKETSLKGKPRPVHLPPVEERKDMNEKELSEWKAAERMKRKASQARLRRAKDCEMEKMLRKLWLALEGEIAQKEGAGSVAETAALVVDSDSGSSCDVKGKCSAEKSGATSSHGTMRSVSKKKAPVPNAVAASKPIPTPPRHLQFDQAPRHDALFFLASIASTKPDAPEEEKVNSVQACQVQTFSLDMMF
jgi:hypothetical protein